jgi:hypothetical protein
VTCFDYEGTHISWDFIHGHYYGLDMKNYLPSKKITLSCVEDLVLNAMFICGAFGK